MPSKRVTADDKDMPLNGRNFLDLARLPRADQTATVSIDQGVTSGVSYQMGLHSNRRWRRSTANRGDDSSELFSRIYRSSRWHRRGLSRASSQVNVVTRSASDLTAAIFTSTQQLWRSRGWVERPQLQAAIRCEQGLLAGVIKKIALRFELPRTTGPRPSPMTFGEPVHRPSQPSTARRPSAGLQANGGQRFGDGRVTVTTPSFFPGGPTVLPKLASCSPPLKIPATRRIWPVKPSGRDVEHQLNMTNDLRLNWHAFGSRISPAVPVLNPGRNTNFKSRQRIFPQVLFRIGGILRGPFWQKEALSSRTGCTALIFSAPFNSGARPMASCITS